MIRFLRLVIRLYPRAFRIRYSDEVIGHLEQQSQAVKRRGGWMGVVRFWSFQTVDLILSAWSERQAHPRTFPGAVRCRAYLTVASIMQDVRFAFNAVRQRPGFSAIAALTIGLGIGATTALFSVLNVVVLKPLPYDHAEDLVSVSHLAPGLENSRLSQSAATFETYREEQRVFDALGIWAESKINVSGTSEAEQVDAVWMTAEVFQALRVQPSIGRPFANVSLQSDVRPAVISYGFWQRHFGGTPDIIGETLQQENVQWEICGVMPEGFRFLDAEPSVYLPVFLPEAGSAVMGKFDYEGIARLKPGIALAEANEDVNRMIPLSVERFAWTSQSDLAEWRLTANVYPLADDVVGDVRQVLWILFGTFCMVLVIASANVANLFLVRAEARQHEIALRAAVGASRTRVVRLFLSESMLIGLAGGLAGAGIAYAATRLLIALDPSNLPNIERISLSPVVLLFALLVSVVTGLLCGFWPTLHYTNPNLATSLKEACRASGDGKPRHRLRTFLAAVEVSLALVLVIGSGLLVRSFQALRAVSPGIDRPEELLSFRLTMPVLDHYLDADGTLRFTEDVLRQLSATPGITAASATSVLPIGDQSISNAVYVEDRPIAGDRLPPLRRYKGIAAGYFRTMGIPMLAGRDVSWNDIHDRQAVAVVTENFAREYWPEPNAALGKRIKLDPKDRWHQIVGVVGNVHDAGLQEDAPPIVYFPMAVEQLRGIPTWIRRSMTYVVRAAGADPMAVLPRVRSIVFSLKPNVPVADRRMVGDMIATSMARTTFTLILLGVAAVGAVLIGAVGVYGVISYIFAQRTGELGVRIALGAGRLDVAWLVLKNVGLITGLGLTMGLITAVGLTRILSSLLFGVTPADPLSYFGAVCLVLTMSLLASILPTRKALSVDGVQSLRSD